MLQSLFTWQPWKQVSQHQHRCFQSVIIIIVVIVIIINAIVIIFFVISVILAFYWLFRINCLNLRLGNFPNYWLLRLLLKYLKSVDTIHVNLLATQ